MSGRVEADAPSHEQTPSADLIDNALDLVYDLIPEWLIETPPAASELWEILGELRRRAKKGEIPDPETAVAYEGDSP